MSAAAGWTPVDESQSAWTPVQEKDDYKPGLLHAAGETVWNTLKGIAMPSATSPYPGMDLDAKQAVAQQSAGEMRQRQTEGRSLPYQTIAPIGQALGIDVAGQENAVRHGDPAGVLGHALGSAAVVAAPLAIEGVAKGVNRLVPSTTRAGKGLNTLEKTQGTAPINPSGAMNTINRFADELSATPSVKLHPLLEDFRQRMITSDVASTHPEVAQQLAEQGLPTSNPLTFKEARSLLKRLNEAKVGAKGVEYNSLTSTADALSKDISAGADAGGFGRDYRNQVNEFRRGSKIIRAADNAGPVVGGAVGAAVGREVGHPLEGAGLGAMAGRALGKPVIGNIVRSMIERDAGAPRLSSPRYTPAEFTRMLLQAKEGDLNPAEADRVTAKFTRKLARPQSPPDR